MENSGKCTLTLFRNEKHKTVFRNVISEKLRKQFCFLTCILPDYVAHEKLQIISEKWPFSKYES